MIPKLEFIYLYPKSHYLWIKDNPMFADVAAMSLEDITDVVFASALTVESKIQPKIAQVFEFIEQLSGYEWQDHKIKVYPTFLGPSYSDPLSLRVTEMRDGNMVPLHADQIIGTLIHELSHVNMPMKLFNNRATSEQIMDLTAFKVMNEVSFDDSQYQAWKDLKWAKFGAEYKVGSIDPKELFHPNVRDYLGRISSIDEGALDRV